MADLNRVFLMGRLTFDPELRYTPSGSAVTDLRMATSRAWTGKDGDRKEETLYIDVTVWDRQAENCCQYLKKGSGIHVEGLAQDGHLGRQDDRGEALEDQGAGRAGPVPRPPRRRGGRGLGGRAGPAGRPRLAAQARRAPLRRARPGQRAGRGGYPAPGNAPSRRPPAAPEPEEDDIPF